MAIGRLLASSKVFSLFIELSRSCEIALHKHEDHEACFQHHIKYLDTVALA